MHTFSIEDYPKQYASIKQNDYRLKVYLSKSNDELNSLFHALESFCITRAQTMQPIKAYKNLPYLGSGWEYSVFRLSDTDVIKIPAGIFPEVNTAEYLKNSQYAYKAVGNYFGDIFTAKTTFQRENNLNVIQQEYIPGNSEFTIPFGIENTVLLEHLRLFSSIAKKMIHEIAWIPDFDFGKTEKGFLLRNIIIEQSSSLPKIIDTTCYLDQNRMYLQLEVDALAGMTERISQFDNWLNSK